jgi:hypothetical protein
MTRAGKPRTDPRLGNFGSVSISVEVPVSVPVIASISMARHSAWNDTQHVIPAKAGIQFCRPNATDRNRGSGAPLSRNGTSRAGARKRRPRTSRPRGVSLALLTVPGLCVSIGGPVPPVPPVPGTRGEHSKGGPEGSISDACAACPAFPEYSREGPRGKAIPSFGTGDCFHGMLPKGHLPGMLPEGDFPGMPGRRQGAGRSAPPLYSLCSSYGKFRTAVNPNMPADLRRSRGVRFSAGRCPVFRFQERVYQPEMHNIIDTY